MLSDTDLQNRLQASVDADEAADPLVIVPLLKAEPTGMFLDGGAIHGCSIDLRLGTWFEVTRPHTRASRQIVRAEAEEADDERPGKTIYVPYGKEFFLHPGSFVLGVTLEWIRMPQDLAGTVSGKSQWTRRGLSIAASTVVHPRFVGCLTLELANIGEHPIALSPGISVCQITIQELSSASLLPMHASPLIGHRRAVHTEIRPDSRAAALKKER
jgi:dCTP deaminase